MEWFSFMSIIFVLLFVISFATGPGKSLLIPFILSTFPGSIPWFYVNEASC